MSGETHKAVVAAIAGNLAIAVTKLAAAAFSGSASMLSEGIHSIVDTGNGALMLNGIRRSKKPPDERHPLGYGHELYFWTLLVGVLIFGLGGGMSIVTGVVHILHRTEPETAWWTYAVLGAATVFEAGSWYFGYRAFRAESRGRGVIATIRRSKDPTAFSVLLEDSAALLGLLLAFAGVALSAWLDKPWIDGLGSVLIGVLLCAVAIVMVYESMGLIAGEGMERAALEEIETIVRSDPAVRRVDRLLTLYLGPKDVMLAIDLRLSSRARVADVRAAIARIKEAIAQRYPEVRHVYLDTVSSEEREARATG
jgi:cation diffusion facilitator family transporter